MGVSKRMTCLLYTSNPPADYEIPPAYLEDEQFARLIEEAEKYVGFPYVWDIFAIEPVWRPPDS